MITLEYLQEIRRRIVAQQHRHATLLALIVIDELILICEESRSGKADKA